VRATIRNHPLLITYATCFLNIHSFDAVNILLAPLWRFALVVVALLAVLMGLSIGLWRLWKSTEQQTKVKEITAAMFSIINGPVLLALITAPLRSRAPAVASSVIQRLGAGKRYIPVRALLLRSIQRSLSGLTHPPVRN
jgi:hypothetical protein